VPGTSLYCRLPICAFPYNWDDRWSPLHPAIC
jgi:hypothetical protein